MRFHSRYGGNGICNGNGICINRLSTVTNIISILYYQLYMSIFISLNLLFKISLKILNICCYQSHITCSNSIQTHNWQYIKSKKWIETVFKRKSFQIFPLMHWTFAFPKDKLQVTHLPRNQLSTWPSLISLYLQFEDFFLSKKTINLNVYCLFLWYLDTEWSRNTFPLWNISSAMLLWW